MLTLLKTESYDQTLRGIIALSLYQPSQEKLDAVLSLYKTQSTHKLYGWFHLGQLAGVLGVDQSNPNHVIICHMSVAESLQGQGIGKRMLLALASQNYMKSLEVETDDDAVGFYKACNFIAQKLNEVYPGIQRYRCTLKL